MKAKGGPRRSEGSPSPAKGCLFVGRSSLLDGRFVTVKTTSPISKPVHTDAALSL